jgi:hypothetical protein
MKTLSKILNKEFDFIINHLGLFLTDELHIVDKYIVIIEGQDFEYSCGIGHRIELDRFKRDEFKKLMNKNPKKDKANLYLYIDQLKKVSKPKPLNIDDILYSLVLDSQASLETFDDFCDNFGYDNDSIKANEIYKACQKNAKKVKTFIKDLHIASELFQDY